MRVLRRRQGAGSTPGGRAAGGGVVGAPRSGRVRLGVVVGLCALVATLPVVPAAAGEVCEWTASGGSWQSAANWSCAEPPGPEDDAIIDVAGDYTITTTGDISVGSLQLGRAHVVPGPPAQQQQLRLDGRRLTIARPSHIRGQGQVFSQTGAAVIDGAGTLLNHGAMLMRHTTVEVDLTNALQAEGLLGGVIQFRGNSVVNGALTNDDADLHIVRGGSGSSSTAQPALTVAEDFTNSGFMQIFGDNDLFANNTVGLRITDGSFVNAGHLETHGFSNAGGRPIIIDAEFHNQGEVHLLLATLALHGADAAHTNSGTIWFPPIPPEFPPAFQNAPKANLVVTQTGGDATFTNTGLIELPAGHQATTSGGAFINEGTVRHTQEVTGEGAMAFGVAGASRPTIDVTAQGSLSSLTVDDVGADHADADERTATGRHWLIDHDGDGFTADLALPLDFSVESSPEACRFDAGWDCDADAVTPTTVTRTALTSFSGWAVGADPERTEPTPTPAPSPSPTQAPQASADLSVVKQAERAEATVGQLVRYRITVANAGPDSAPLALVTDTLPAQVTFSDATAGCDHHDGTVTCALGELAAGATTDLVVVTTAATPGAAVNTASVGSATADPDTDNNSGTATTTISAPEVPTERIAGVTRIETAVRASATTFDDDEADVVILARSDTFPDALAGSPLAVALHGPLLLTTPTSLHPATAAELGRVLGDDGTVHLLGGTAALSDDVAEAVNALGYPTVRHAGADRYATAATIAAAVPDAQFMFAATGTDFPDALAAGTVAAGLGGVIVLTNGDTVPEPTQAFLARHPGLEVHAAGGPAARALPDASAHAGADRYATATSIAQAFYPDPTAAGIATGVNFADALSGAVHLGRRRAPMLLSHPTTLPDPVDSYLTSRPRLATAFIFGGPSALNDHVEQTITAALTAQ